MRDTAPPRADPRPKRDPWQRAALLEGVTRDSDSLTARSDVDRPEAPGLPHGFRGRDRPCPA